ncbi:hypothetical protein HDV00_003392 [Rhizophlyctis rosea]|nr:hypothetical protein HDV00_003392 [Rhizophlyctis rosea]
MKKKSPAPTPPAANPLSQFPQPPTLLKVHVKPNAKVSQVTDIFEDHIAVQLAAPAQDGEANAELIRFIAEVLKVKKYEVSLATGQKSREKVLKIESLRPEDVRERLKGGS